MLTRTATGLLFRDQFDRANGPPGANYTPLVNGSRYSIVGGKLVCTVSGDGDAQLEISAVADRLDTYLQYTLARSHTNYLSGHYSRVNAAGSQYLSWHPANWLSGRVLIFNESAVLAQSAATNPMNVAGQTYRVNFLMRGNLRRMYSDGVLLVEVTHAGNNNVGDSRLKTERNAGTLGGTATFDDLILCTDSRVTLSGLPAGWKMRVNGVITAEVGGVATYEAAGLALPLGGAVEVLNAANVAQATLTPSDGIWGGDAFTYSMVAPTTPTVTKGARTLSTLAFTSSAFADPDGGAHESSRWQLAAIDDVAFAAPVLDTGWSAADKLALLATGLEIGTGYRVRVKHRDEDLLESAWSAVVTATTVGLPFAKIPRFVLGAIDFSLRNPVGLWRLEVRTVGGEIASDAEYPTSFLVRRDHLLIVPLRLEEWEWPQVRDFILEAQLGEAITWRPDAAGAAISVYLESPAAGEDFLPEPDGAYPRLLVLEIGLRRTDGAVWSLPYFDDEA